ncbi:hypothetical protein C8J56DRAFT_898970 [Mycena floridula]|nr:hypothetical protein C8J56DRAFT_898970 [Mycena floridula]
MTLVPFLAQLTARIGQIHVVSQCGIAALFGWRPVASRIANSTKVVVPQALQVAEESLRQDIWSYSMLGATRDTKALQVAEESLHQDIWSYSMLGATRDTKALQVAEESLHQDIWSCLPLGATGDTKTLQVAEESLHQRRTCHVVMFAARGISREVSDQYRP